MSVITISKANFQTEVLHSEKAGPAGLLGPLVRPLPDGGARGGRDRRRADRPEGGEDQRG